MTDDWRAMLTEVLLMCCVQFLQADLVENFLHYLHDKMETDSIWQGRLYYMLFVNYISGGLQKNVPKFA